MTHSAFTFEITPVTFLHKQMHRLTSSVIGIEKNRSNAELLATNDKIAEDINDCPTALVFLIREFISTGSKTKKKVLLPLKLMQFENIHYSIYSRHPCPPHSTTLLHSLFSSHRAIHTHNSNSIIRDVSTILRNKGISIH